MALAQPSQGSLNALSHRERKAQKASSQDTKHNPKEQPQSYSPTFLNSILCAQKLLPSWKKLIKAEQVQQEVYVLLLCQHASEEDNFVASSFLVLVFQLFMCANIWHYFLSEMARINRAYTSFQLMQLTSNFHFLVAPAGELPGSDKRLTRAVISWFNFSATVYISESHAHGTPHFIMPSC